MEHNYENMENFEAVMKDDYLQSKKVCSLMINNTRELLHIYFKTDCMSL